MVRSTMLSFGACALLCAGCTTLTAEREAQESRERAELGAIRLEVQRLRDRVDGLAAAQERVFRETEDLRRQNESARQGLDARIGQVSSAVDQAAASREKLRQEIVDSLAKQMSEVMRAQQGGAASRRVERGYEHVVKQGETLSQIAAAYKVTVKAISEANGLKSDVLRIGQTLFIPE